jgi:proteasome accessory factor BC
VSNTTASEQLRRLLLTIPLLDDDRAHPLDEVAARIGADVNTLVHDLRVLVDRDSVEPAGFMEAISLTLDAESVRLERPSHFRRPMAMTTPELRALDLALAIQRQEAGPEEHGVIDATRERLDAVAGTPLPDDAPAHAVHLGAIDPEIAERRRLLDDCIEQHCIADISYQRAGDSAHTRRQVTPLGFVFARANWYLVAGTVPTGDLRVFRLDRIAEVAPTGQTFDPPADFVLDDVLREGRVFVGEVREELHVRYSPRIARWISEREGIALADDGSVTVVYPLADPEWAVGHVLQYGPDAEVLEPESVRALVLDRLGALLDELTSEAGDQ